MVSYDRYNSSIDEANTKNVLRKEQKAIFSEG